MLQRCCGMEARRVRTRSPSLPPPGHAHKGRGESGAGPAAPPGKLREAGSLCHILLLRPLPASCFGPGPSRGSEGTEPWRTRPASTVRADGEGGLGALRVFTWGGTSSSSLGSPSPPISFLLALNLGSFFPVFLGVVGASGVPKCAEVGVGVCAHPQLECKALSV